MINDSMSWYRILFLCSQVRACRTISRRTVRIDRACSLFGIVRPTKIILIRSGSSFGDKGRDRAMSDTLCGNVITLPFKAVCAKDGSRVAQNSLMTQLECRYYRRRHNNFYNSDALQLDSYQSNQLLFG